MNEADGSTRRRQYPKQDVAMVHDSGLHVGMLLSHPLHGNGRISAINGDTVTITTPDPCRNTGPGRVQRDVAGRMKFSSSSGMSNSVPVDVLLGSELWRLAPTAELIADTLATVPGQSVRRSRTRIDADVAVYDADALERFAASSGTDDDDLVGLTHRLSGAVSMSLMFSLYRVSAGESLYRRANRVRGISRTAGSDAWQRYVYPVLPDAFREHVCDLIAATAVFYDLAHEHSVSPISGVVDLVEKRVSKERAPVDRIHSALQSTVKQMQERKDRHVVPAPVPGK